MRIAQGAILAALVVIAGLLFSISQKMSAPPPAAPVAPVVSAPVLTPPPPAIEVPAPVHTPAAQPTRKTHAAMSRRPSPLPIAKPKTTSPPEHNPVAPTREAVVVPPAPITPPAPPPPPPPPPPVKTFTVPAGTSFTVRLLDPISTDHNRQGDTFQASLEDDLIGDGGVVARRGANVVGRIAQLKQSGRVAGVAEMALEVDRISTVNGEIQIASDTMMRQGESTKGKDAATIGVLAGIGAAIGGIAGGRKGAGIGAAAGGAGGTGEVLATRGKPVKYDREARLTFRLWAPISVTTEGDQQQPRRPSESDRDRPILRRR